MLNFDTAYLVSFVQVDSFSDFPWLQGFAKDNLLIVENSETGSAMGFYGGDVAACQTFFGDYRYDVVSDFIDKNLDLELFTFFSTDVSQEFFRELINGSIEGDLSDFEYENNLPTTVLGDNSDPDLDLSNYLDCRGVCVAQLSGTSIGYKASSKELFFQEGTDFRVSSIEEIGEELEGQGKMFTVLLPRSLSKLI